jgi:molybdate transport system substrate-binding protein
MTAGNPLKIERLEDLARAEVERVAIANPEHAPYGIAAREALQAARVWEVVLPKCVFGENVRQTLQFAESGNVNVSIVALSLSVQSGGRWVLIPEELHRPLDQALAIIKGSRREQQARQFTAFINGEEGRAVMRKYGFVPPGEPIAGQ